jgi:hypothetical protein
MEEARRQLPIIGLEQEIMEGINHNDVVVSMLWDLASSQGLSQGLSLQSSSHSHPRPALFVSGGMP